MYGVLLHALVLTALFGTYESQAAEVKIGKRTFKIPDGFELEQVAGPPLVRYPLFGCFNDQSRLYVAEGTGLNVPGTELGSAQK